MMIIWLKQSWSCKGKRRSAPFYRVCIPTFWQGDWRNLIGLIIHNSSQFNLQIVCGISQYPATGPPISVKQVSENIPLSEPER